MSNEFTVEELVAAIEKTKEAVRWETSDLSLEVGGEDVEYVIVNKVKSDFFNQLNAMAIAPVVDGKPDYQNVAVVIAGTNTWPADEGGTGYLSAIQAMAGQVSGEYGVAKHFLRSTQEKVAKHGGRITDVAGFSQSAGYIPLLTAVYGEEYGFDGTAFDDWGSLQSLSIPVDRLAWLRENPHRLTIYRNDSWAGLPPRDNLVGTIIETGVKEHSTLARYFDGDFLDLDRLAKEGFYAPGMTEAQVRVVALRRVRDDPDPSKSPAKDELLLKMHMQAYLDKYGKFGTGKSPRGGSGKTVGLHTAFMLSGPALIDRTIEQLRSIQESNDALPEKVRASHVTALDASAAAFSGLTTRYDIEAELHRRGALPEHRMSISEIERVHREIEQEIEELDQLRATITQVVARRDAQDREDARFFGF